MANNKLLRLLRSLDKTELKDLSKFIHSDYFKVSKACIRLFNGLQKYAPTFDERQIDKIKLWKKVYPHTKSGYTLKRLTNKMSDLSKEVERFLVIQSIEKKEEKYQFQQLKAKAFKAHNLYTDFKKEVQELLKKEQVTKLKGVALYRELAALSHQRYFHAKNHKIELKEFSFEKIWKAHQQFSLLGNLVYTIESINRHQILGESIDFLNYGVLERQIAQNKESQSLLIQLFIQLYQLITSKNHSLQKFDKVADLIIAHLKSVDFESKEILLVSLSNYLTKRVYEGQTTFKSKMFKIYYALYQEGVFTKHGSLGESTFLNMVNYSIHYKGADWTSKFIVEATPKLESSIRERVTELGWVYFYFGTKQYEKAAKKLIIQKGTNHIFKMRMRSLSVRIYYEISLTDPTYFATLFNACTQFLNFLKKEKAFTESRKVSYLNFLKIVRKLAKYRQNNEYSNTKRMALCEHLNNTKQIALKEWLEEKVQE